MINPFVVPKSWNSLFLKEGPMTKTFPFWSCVVALTYAVLEVSILMFRIASITRLAIFPLATIVAVLLYLGWKFLVSVQQIRQNIETMPAQNLELTLTTGRGMIHQFSSLMFGIAIISQVGILMLRK